MNIIEPFVKLFKDKGYTWFDQGSYNLNIFGIRCNSNVTNLFDDVIFCVFKDNSDKWIIKQWAATTDPGLSSLKDPMNSAGTAILVPGQYRASHKLGLHRGKYEALVQQSPVRVYRDANRDNKYDMNPSKIQTGLFGINIHKAGQNSTWVDNWSAGCQVFKKSNDFADFISIIKKAVKAHGNSFTYTLFDNNCNLIKD